jgi:hypothetical protein
MFLKCAVLIFFFSLATLVHALNTVPEEARRAFVQGTTLAKEAKTPEQQLLAVESFQKAVDLAPRWGPALYNLAVAQELAGRYIDAQATLKRYIAAKPGEKEIRKAQDKIYALEARAKLAAVSGAEDQAKKAEEEKQALLRSLDGAKFRYEMFDAGGTLLTRFELEVRGGTIYAIDTPMAGSRDVGSVFTMSGPLNGLSATLCCGVPGTLGGDPNSKWVVEIAPDGQSATRKFFIPDGRNIETFHYRRR